MGIIIAVILLAVWIYLVYVTLIKKTDLFHDQMEPELAERRLRRLKKFLLVAGISVAAVIPTTLYAAIVDTVSLGHGSDPVRGWAPALEDPRNAICWPTCKCSIMRELKKQ